MLWLAFVGFVFWHDVSEHPLRAEDRPLADRTMRLLAPQWRITPDALARTTYPSVSRSNGRTCVALKSYPPRHREHGEVCYAPDGRVLEERIFGDDF